MREQVERKLGAAVRSLRATAVDRIFPIIHH